ncbi:hypothetical protein GCM10009737_27210 [Nocardioides lentus]|uniref:Uncharacterized protein n=1 Tax=Nocardioides lentus TaxID=338077 RepID=A0ABP5AY25_9ACTN
MLNASRSHTSVLGETSSNRPFAKAAPTCTETTPATTSSTARFTGGDATGGPTARGRPGFTRVSRDVDSPDARAGLG